MDDDERSIELEIEVVGTPEEVWQAIATGPGISSWYVPHTVEEREGGAATARFLRAASKPVMGSAVPTFTSVVQWLSRRQNETVRTVVKPRQVA